jgi:hypothetical protein
MGSRVETFEQIRRDREGTSSSQESISSRYGPSFGASRPTGLRFARQRCGQPDAPPADEPHTSPPTPASKRIWERLRDEHAADVAERTGREYVHGRRRERGEGVEAFVSQVHAAGVEAELDWGEADSVSALRWITTSSCSPASRVRWPARSLSPRNASAAPGHRPSMSSGARSPSATAPQRPPGRWSTCCCSPASMAAATLSW